MDPQRQGLERQVQGAGQGRGQAARRLPDRRRSGRARRPGTSKLPAAPVDPEGTPGREPRLLCLRPAGRPRRGHPQALHVAAEGAARGAARRRRAADPLWRSCRRARRGPVRRNLQAGRRRDHLEEGQCALSRHAHPRLAQDQMHPAPGVRDRRLVGKRQAPRLPLAAARRPRGRQAALCRQGRNRLQRQADRGADGADGAARDRQGRARGPARRPQGGALDQAQAGRRNRLHRSSPTTASCATPASSRCARTSPRRKWCAKCPSTFKNPRKKSASGATRRKPRDQDHQSRPHHLSRGRADQGRPRRLLRRDRTADHGRCGRPADDADPLPAGPGQEMLLPEA